MESSPPLRWLAAFGVMFVVVLVAGSLLINTLGNTVSLSGDASEAPDSEFADQPSDSPSAAGAGGSEAAGDDDSDGGSDESTEPSDEFPQQYTVESGDTGNDISERFYGNRDGWPAIAEANDIDPGAPLRVGEELEIPAPE